MPYRIVSRPKRRTFYALLLAGAVASFLAFGLVLAQRFDASYVTCTQVQKLDRVIHAVLVQSYESLGAKGGAGYAYYRAHPAELAAARLALRREILQFTAWRC